MQTKIRFDIKFHTNLQIIFLIYHFLLVHAGLDDNGYYTSVHFFTQTSFRVASGLPTSTTSTLCKALAITY